MMDAPPLPPPEPGLAPGAEQLPLPHVIVDEATGEVVRTMRCTPAMALLQVRAGERLVQAAASRATHWWDGQALATYTPAQAQAKAERPAWRARWDNAAMAWADLRTLDELQAEKWAAIKARRDAVEFGGFAWEGSVFDSDQAAQGRIMGAVQMAALAQAAGQAFGIAWALADNSVRTLDGAQMQAVGLALGAHVAAAHETARALRSLIFDASATAESVAAVQWPE